MTRIETNGSVFQKTRLRNGLRVVTESLPSARSISIGVWVDVGSRHEADFENGLSHFVEHLVFKGTRRRNARQIASSLESLGGSINAFTSREQTCFTAKVLDEHLDEAIDVLADISCHATMTPTNMNRERQVICEEIKESLDTPSDYIHDLFALAYWENHPLGQAIMGPQGTIEKVTRGTLTRFMKRHYRSGSVVIAASGAVTHRRLVKLVREKFQFEEGKSAPATGAITPDRWRQKIQPLDSSQTHFCMGFPGLGYSDPDKLAVMALSAHLGGGMSSVLFQKIREERGLAYNVFCYHDNYADAGIFEIYLGTDHTRLREAYDIVMQECRRVKKTRLSSRALSQVKAQIKGNLILALESTSHRMSRLGRQELMTGEYVPIEDIARRIDALTPTDILNIANRVIDESRPALAVLGPVAPDIFADIAPAP